MLKGVLVTIAALTAAAGLGAPAGAGGFFVGFDEDAPKDGWGPLPFMQARAAGASACRITLMWAPGQTIVADADVAKLDRAVSGAAANGMKIVLAVYAASPTDAPQDDLARGQYCAYVRNALIREPAVNDVVIWNEPNSPPFWKPQFNADGANAAPAAYEALAARCWDVLHGFRSGINVIAPATAPRGNDTTGHSPGNFIRKLGDAYRASGRTLPILDTVGHHVYGDNSSERPWYQHIGTKSIAEGDWNKLMSNLNAAFSGTAQPIPGECEAHGHCVEIWYLESGFQTVIEASKSTLYMGAENEPRPVPDYAGGEPEFPPPDPASRSPDQSTQILDSVRLAACQPYVEGYFNFLLWDEQSLGGWQSGPYWWDHTPKDSLAAFQRAFGEATGGTVNCSALKGGRPSADYISPSTVADLNGQGYVTPLRIQLSWSVATDDSGPVEGYRVYRDGAYYAWSPTSSYTDTAVLGETPYTYTVYAQDAAGNLGSVSNRATVSVDTVAPSAAGSLTATAIQSPAQVTLSWTAATDDVGVAGYRVYRDGVVVGDTAETTYTDLTVTGPVTYTYTVSAYDAAGNAGPAASATVTTPDVVPPTAVASLSARARSKPRKVIVTWGEATDNVGVAGYRLYRRGVLLASTIATTYTDRRVAAARSYTYAVAANDAAGNVGASTPVTVRTKK